MKNLLFYITIIIFTLSSCNSIKNTAQENRKQSKITAEERANNATQAINSQDFVLEAEYIIPRSGRSIYVMSNTNFISVKNGKATIQLALSNQFLGPNGIGGITLDGTVTDSSIKTDKKGTLFYTMNVQGTGLSATVTFSMTKGTNRCSATVNPNFSGNIITFSGFVYPSSDSIIYKGTSL